MIRFIDLRDQICDVEERPVEFAFFDTVTERFIELDDAQTWMDRSEFISYHASSGVGEHDSRKLSRFLKLMPEWVP